MDEFRFVTLTHPDAIKDKANQTIIRAHVRQGSLQKARVKDIQSGRNFVSATWNLHCPRYERRKRKSTERAMAVPERSPSISQLDPFNSLPGSLERLRTLMSYKIAKQAGEPIFCVGSSGNVLFKDSETVFRGALADTALFNALSLSLALAANGGSPNTECLTYKGELLKELRKRITSEVHSFKDSTMISLLLLIGYEYRNNDASYECVEAHLRAVQELVKMYNKSNVFFCDTIRRALFWQDLMSSLVLGTQRFLSHELLPELSLIRDPFRKHFYIITLGFNVFMNVYFPSELSIVLEDTNALCTLIDSRCMCGHVAISNTHIGNMQAWIESRLANLLDENKRSQMSNPVYEACLYAIYMCTYQLSTAIWDADFIPSFCASQILRILRVSGDHIGMWPDFLTWLLYVGSAFTDQGNIKLEFAALMFGSFRDQIGDLHKTWDALEKLLKGFVWSEATMSRRMRKFWEEVHPC